MENKKTPAGPPLPLEASVFVRVRVNKTLFEVGLQHCTEASLRPLLSPCKNVLADYRNAIESSHKSTKPSCKWPPLWSIYVVCVAASIEHKGHIFALETEIIENHGPKSTPNLQGQALRNNKTLTQRGEIHTNTQLGGTTRPESR